MNTVASHSETKIDQMPPTDYDRERWWWDHKAPNEEGGFADESINRALRWREIDRHLEGVRSILEIGGGTGAFSIPLAKRGYRVTHVDLSPKMIELAKAKAEGLDNIEFVVANAVDLSCFEDRSFDLVLNMDGAVTFCGIDADKAVAEACRLAKKRVILAVSNRARMIGVALNACSTVLGKSASIVDDMYEDGYFAIDRRPENRRLVEHASETGYFGPMKCYYPAELRDLIEPFDLRVKVCRALGTLASLVGKDAALKLYNQPDEQEQFLDQCERFDIEVMPEGTGTDQRAGVIAVAERDEATIEQECDCIVRLKDGREVSIRRAIPSDAEAVLRYMHEGLPEFTDYILTQPDEFTLSISQERAWIRDRDDALGRIAILALADGEVVGMLSCGTGTHKRIAHVAGIGMTLRQSYWDSGLGSLMLSRLIEWAESHPLLEVLKLSVYSDNDRAVALYKKFGFEEVGRIHQEFKFGPERYKDGITMCRRVGIKGVSP